MSGRKRGQHLAAALFACGGIGGEVEAAAVRQLAGLFAWYRTRERVAAVLGISDRQLRRIVDRFGMRMAPPTTLAMPVGRKSHPTYEWCHCAHCDWSRLSHETRIRIGRKRRGVELRRAA